VLDPVQLAPGAGWWHQHGPAVSVAGLYAIVAGSYIVVSSSAVSNAEGAAAEIAKGLGFVVVTAIVLVLVLVEYGRRSAAAARRLRELIESAGDLTYRFRRWPTVGFEYMSPAVVDWVGLTSDDHYANPDIGMHLVHPDDRTRLSHLVARGRSDGPVPLRWLAPDGRVLHTEHDFFDVRDRRGRVIAVDGRIRNVTEARRDRAEAELGLAIWGWLGDDAVSVDTLVSRVCDGIVQLMGVEIAWIGVPLADGSVRVEYAAGDPSLVDDLEVRWDEGPLAMGPSGRAIRDREPVLMRPSDPGYAAWRQRARDAGVTAVLGVPIVERGRVLAVLTVLSRFGNPFDAPNIERFSRIASRLAGAAVHIPVRPITGRGAGSAPPLLSGVDVRAALDDGRVEVWWQPQVAPDGTIVALEALVRIRERDGTVLTPDAILPAAEENGLMVPLGQAVRRRAVEQSTGWLEGGLQRICLNVSVVELLSPGFVAELEDLVALNELRPDQIELELIETEPLDATALRLLTRLEALGFRIAVDDYGSGWASLGHLARIPALVLKVDRVFIRDLTTSERARALVRSTFELGHVLDLETVAEGVETVEQAELLCDMGCDLLQGFLFARPLDRAATDALLRGIGTEHWPRLRRQVVPGSMPG
jgi:EAL domain-containing protein (putative c-di-GMP-specific phosphodiesterase class I)/PAS domain-containing protein